MHLFWPIVQIFLNASPELHNGNIHNSKPQNGHSHLKLNTIFYYRNTFSLQSVVEKVITVNKTEPDQFKADEIVNVNTAIFCKGRHARVKVHKIYSLQIRITQQTCKVEEIVNSANYIIPNNS